MITLLNTFVMGMAPGGFESWGTHWGFLRALPVIADVAMPVWLVILGATMSVAGTAVAIWATVTNRAQRMEVQQPLEVAGADPFVKHSVFAQRCAEIEKGSLHRRSQSEREHITAMESVERLETQLSEMRAENEERAVKLHARVNVLVESNGEITGEIKHLTIAVNNATKAAQDAAIAAARAGGARR